ncbi:Ppx/GppA phosphatase family protein [Corynebacterium pygosceleis]|uniref:Ppx/GppA phosphatase family protein n=1 Tax=Corynebacterium pygosceleis TaxID=2800406 RepID=A0A9Q4C9S9_9CORY|nr:Ppx/GppA phosphatase family protein [Corynebacterium pygosceleis]MCK7637423.1 Ppx/GppA family phosphatase [Corynebacterium pygosceleis]MCK7676073.1 Ppx/GppA family phosphatase [Corynebacterium pygosceleis]MCL0119801.1 Ppx/GppA family phosphatase [Corynebacterium pygosceleis]MCX7445327.1 Ppx/GppA phosphatase family protein [Corynebacterium pygosceleis]MCX7468248.1 Ppx/GppA phosphatase family protein [Corynebacterium pygosceleis]
MRLGVLDVGSNTVHLVVVDARAGGRPTAMSDWKTTMRLVEFLDADGAINDKGIKRLVKGVTEASELTRQLNCEDILPFATSAIRSATNGQDVIDTVERETGVRLEVLSGEDEARLTFLAVRRWYGWSTGRIVNLDIGGGSLELSTGTDEVPDAAFSLDLGAGRLTHQWFDTDPPQRKTINVLRDYIDAELVEPAKMMKRCGRAELAVGTSKTFRTLARLTGAAPSSAGPRVKRTLTAPGLRQLIAFISRMTAADRAELEGVSSDRSHQIVAGALVAEAAMRGLGLEQLEICPWALREGVILRRTEQGMDYERTRT